MLLLTLERGVDEGGAARLDFDCKVAWPFWALWTPTLCKINYPFDHLTMPQGISTMSISSIPLV